LFLQHAGPAQELEWGGLRPVPDELRHFTPDGQQLRQVMPVDTQVAARTWTGHMAERTVQLPPPETCGEALTHRGLQRPQPFRETHGDLQVAMIDGA